MSSLMMIIAFLLSTMAYRDHSFDMSNMFALAHDLGLRSRPSPPRRCLLVLLGFKGIDHEPEAAPDNDC